MSCALSFVSGWLSVTAGVRTEVPVTILLSASCWLPGMRHQSDSGVPCPLWDYRGVKMELLEGKKQLSGNPSEHLGSSLSLVTTC